MAGVTSRLAEEQDPVRHSLGGDPGAWEALLRHYGAAVVDPANQ
jgi:hypothetical protein